MEQPHEPHDRGNETEKNNFLPKGFFILLLVRERYKFPWFRLETQDQFSRRSLTCKSKYYTRRNTISRPGHNNTSTRHSVYLIGKKRISTSFYCRNCETDCMKLILLTASQPLSFSLLGFSIHRLRACWAGEF